MKKELTTRLANVGLRGLSMASRFILIFAIAKILSPQEVGLFGLMLATVSLSVLIIGADYYTYAQRELLARRPEHWSFVIQHQTIAQGLIYTILLPAQAIIFIGGWMDWQYAIWFFLLLIFEHIAQEINRLLVAMHKQLLASWILFIRMGSWVVVIIPLMVFFPELQNLESLYIAWLAGVLLAILWGLWFIRINVPIWKKYPLDKSWIKQGFKVGGLFLLATICFKGLQTFDRYAVENLSNLDMLGVYVFYIGIVMGLFNFLDPAVFSFLYPRMLQSYQVGKMNEYSKTFKELIWSTTLISILLAGFIWLFMPYIVGWIDKPMYEQNLASLNMLILAGVLYALSMIPHYALYAKRKDKSIVFSHLSALVLFFVSLIFVNLDTAIQTVGLALSIAFGWMLILKTVALQLSNQTVEFKA